MSNDSALRGELRTLTVELQSALDRFSVESRLLDLAAKDVPDARQRLEHVLRLTDDAAHKTLELVEKSGPLADAAGQGAFALLASIDAGEPVETHLRDFLCDTRAGMATLKENLSAVLLAQGYQDLSGQIIRGVMKLVGELEVALQGLVRISGYVPGASLPQQPAETNSRGFGPVVPGVNHGPSVSGQGDVDSLLADLGM